MNLMLVPWAVGLQSAYISFNGDIDGYVIKSSDPIEYGVVGSGYTLNTNWMHGSGGEYDSVAEALLYYWDTVPAGKYHGQCVLNGKNIPRDMMYMFGWTIGDNRSYSIDDTAIVDTPYDSNGYFGIETLAIVRGYLDQVTLPGQNQLVCGIVNDGGQYLFLMRTTFIPNKRNTGIAVEPTYHTLVGTVGERLTAKGTLRVRSIGGFLTINTNKYQ